MNFGNNNTTGSEQPESSAAQLPQTATETGKAAGTARTFASGSLPDGGTGAVESTETGVTAPDSAGEEYPTLNLALKMLLFGVFMVFITVPLLVLLIFGTSGDRSKAKKRQNSWRRLSVGGSTARFSRALRRGFSTHYLRAGLWSPSSPAPNTTPIILTL